MLKLSGVKMNNFVLNSRLLNLICISLFFLGLNSIFCKLALSSNFIDAFTFTFFRLLFGAITLILIYFYKTKKIVISIKSNWLSSFTLFLYAISFSYAFLNMDAGLGTLILFAVVQVVMVIFSLFFKEKLSVLKIIGIIIALLGLVNLLYPQEGFEVSLFHALLMIIAGISWAIYSVLGKNNLSPLFNTMDNFTKSLIFIGIFYIIFLPENSFYTKEGLFLAFISGSLTSAIGYVLWYEILPKLQYVTAGVIQLFVPIISILIGIIFLNESLTITLLLSTLTIFTGILVTVFY